MIVENLTNTGFPPVTGDLVRITHPNGDVEEVPFHDGIYPEPESIQDKRITRLAFSNRLTFSEEVAIETAAETDPEIRVVLRKLTNANYIDLALPQTEALMSVLIAKNLVTEARKTSVLTDPIQQSERP